MAPMNESFKASVPSMERRSHPTRFTLTLVAILAAGALCIWWLFAHADREMREGLLAQARLVAEAVNIERVKALTGTEADLVSPNYLRMKEKLARVRVAEPRCRFAYLMGREADGTVFFYVDSEPTGSEDESPAGQVYEEVSAEYLHAFDTRTTLVEGPVSDRWGKWVSALVPVTDPQTGELVAVFGMDVDASHWKRDVVGRVALPVGLVLVVIIGVVAILAGSVRAKANLAPVQRRLLIPMTTVLLLLVVGFGVVLLTQYQRHLRRNSEATLSESLAEFETAIEEQSAMLMALQDVVLHDARVRIALASGDSEWLLADWGPLYSKLRHDHGVTHFYFHGPDRVNLLRVHKPKQNGDMIDRFTALQAERTGKTASGIELGPLGTFTLRVVRPVFDGATLVGYLELGKEIEDILSSIHSKSQMELAVVIQKSELTREKWESGMSMLGRQADWDRYDERVLIYSSLSPFPVACDCFVEESGHEHGDTSARAHFDSKPWCVIVSPLQDVSGSIVGDLIVLGDVSAETADFRRLLAVASPAALLALAALIAFFYVRLRRTDAAIRVHHEKLQESRERFVQLAEQSKTITWEVDANGLYSYVSKTVTSVLGYKPDEIVGRVHFYDLHPEAERETFKATALKAFTRKQPFRHLENQVETKTGEVLWVSSNGIPVMDEDGRLVGYRGEDTDITQRKQVEENLKASEAKFRQMIENSNDIIYSLTSEGVFTFVSPAWTRLLGHATVEVEGKSFAEFVHPDDLPNYLGFLERVSATRTRQESVEYRMLHQNGEWRWYTSTASPRKTGSGAAVGHDGLARDITETKRLRDLTSRAERLELAGTIAGQVAHDFNNLLGPMLAYPELIREELPPDTDARRHLKAIEDASAKIRDINQDLLTLGRRGHYNQNVIDLNKVVRRSIGEMKWSLGSVTVELTLCDRLMLMKGGEAQLHRAITNLVLNALDAVQEDGTIALRTENYYANESTVGFERIPQGEYVKLTVSDTGCGIADNVLHSILDPFFSTKKADGKRGSGLGLSVVDSVVRDHRGYMDLSSKVGEGTSFYLYFPVTRESHDDGGGEDTTGGSESILVVDDDEIQRDVLSQLLGKLGYEVCAVECGETALKLQIDNPRELVILDMIMPGGMDGAETYRRLLEILPEQKAIIVSGFAESDRILEAQRLGAEAIVRKPVTMHALAGAVRKALDRDRVPVT